VHTADTVDVSVESSVLHLGYQPPPRLHIDVREHRSHNPTAGRTERSKLTQAVEKSVTIDMNHETTVATVTSRYLST
jgi:hypothetical protein